MKSLSRVRLLATSWTVAHQALRSMGFSRQEYWSGVPLPSLSFLVSLGLMSPKQREEKVKKNHGVLTLQSIQLNGHAMVLSVLDSLGNKTCGIILDMFQCFFSFPLVSLHLHSRVNYTNLSVRVCQVAQSCLTFCNPMDCSPPGSSAHGDSPGKNTGVGCHPLLQGIFRRMTKFSPS